MRQRVLTGWMLARRALSRLWWYLRQVSGDAAYENYLHSRRGTNRAACAPPASPGEFYLESLARRYTRPNRCC
jgi:uncharacterized short protein YbdD (DUF466 family)